jgi:hypothetical protein
MPCTRAPFYAFLVAVVPFLHPGVAVALTPSQATPCGAAWGGQSANGLVSVRLGTIVYDSAQGLCWLADADLAGNPLVRARVPLASLNADGSAPNINPDGSMDYPTALNWVNALNHYNSGKGWLGHNNWQLPTTAQSDPSCSSHNWGNFGVQCTGSALGHLYSVGLARTYPDSVVPEYFTAIWPVFNLRPGLYWTAKPGSSQNNEFTYSFVDGVSYENTTKYNFFHVLPVTKSVLGPVPVGVGVLPYESGPAAGKAVYDSNTGLSWTLDANLPAADAFYVTGTVTITPDQPNDPDVNGQTYTVPLVDKDGAVYFSAVDPANSDPSTSWIAAMNQSGFAGTNTWFLPKAEQMLELYQDLGLEPGDPRLDWWGMVGPFWHLQPGFYWSCVRDAAADARGACDPGISPPSNDSTPMEYGFDFDDGFQGTDLSTKQFYVMVYYPAPSAAP